MTSCGRTRTRSQYSTIPPALVTRARVPCVGKPIPRAGALTLAVPGTGVLEPRQALLRFGVVEVHVQTGVSDGLQTTETNAFCADKPSLGPCADHAYDIRKL